MLDPYRMIVVNLISSLILIFAVFFYRYIFPKKKINLLVLLIFISILPVISIFREGTYESGDFNLHIHRIMFFFDSLKEGILMPSWASGLNATYGIPTYIFNYSLPYYIVSLFHFIGLSFISSMKLFLGLTFVLSGISMYIWTRKITHNFLAAFTGAIFYLFAPYHLINIHFRATPGESLIYAIIPIIFFFLFKYFEENKIIYLICISLTTNLLFLAHPLLAVIFLFFLIVFVLFLFYKNRSTKKLANSIIFLFLGVVSAMYLLAPYQIYSPYVYHLSPGTGDTFYPFQFLFYSPYMFGFLFQGHKGELSQIIGYTQLLVLIISTFLIIFKKIARKQQASLIFWVLASFFTIFLMLPVSSFLWNIYPSAKYMITPYARTLLVTNFCIGTVASYFALFFIQTKGKTKILYILVFLTIAYTLLNWGHRRVIPEINDFYLQENAWKSVEIVPGFMNSKYAPSPSFWFPKKPPAHLEIVEGKGTVVELKRTTTTHTYLIYSESKIVLKENTLYFPGWTLTANYNAVKTFPWEKGEIAAKLDKGIYYVQLTYQDIPTYRITKIISFILFLSFLLGLFWQLGKAPFLLFLRRYISKKH